MKRAPLILFVGGALVAIGMILSYTGASLISGQISIKESLVNSTIPVELEKELDPSITNRGAFVVRAEEFEKTTLVASLYDPTGNQLETKEITQVSTEEYFDIEDKGSYKIIVQNTGSADISIVLGLSHMPDKSIIALNMLGPSMIISGFVGVGAAGLYALKSRKKAS
ncbi:MAG: hypothetical protein ACT4OD_01925 [Candidatus Nitrosotenuis sp.]